MMAIESATGSTQNDLGDLRGSRVTILRGVPIEHDKRTQQIARLLSNAGVDVQVIAPGTASGTVTVEPYGYRVDTVGWLPASHHRVWALRVISNIIRNQIRRATWSLCVIRRVRRFHPQVVHCMNVDTLLLGYLCVGPGRYIYDSREHWATTGTVPRRVRLWWVLKERLLIPRAAAVATVTDMIADALRDEHKIPQPTVLINGSVNAVSEPLEPHEPLRLVHQGKFYRDRHLEDLIDAVLRHRGKAVLALQGWGEAENDIRDFINAREAEDVVTIVSPVPLGEAVISASAHDVGLIDIWPDSMSHRWAGSNKLFDYMAAGLAMVVTNLDFTRQVVEAAGCGIIVDPPTVDGFAEAIGWLVQNPQEVARMKRNAVAAAPRYTWDGQAEVLYGLYRAALGGWLGPAVPGHRA